MARQLTFEFTLVVTLTAGKRLTSMDRLDMLGQVIFPTRFIFTQRARMLDLVMNCFNVLFQVTLALKRHITMLISNVLTQTAPIIESLLTLITFISVSFMKHIDVISNYVSMICTVITKITVENICFTI